MIYRSEGKKIFYNDSGKGKPIVLLHGYLETSGIWNGFAERLAEEFRVISIDLPGHGGSDPFGTTLTMEHVARVVNDLATAAGIDKFFLTGHSMGGYATLAFLDLFHTHLSGYCLFHSHPFPDTPQVAEKRMREIAMVREGKKELFCRDDVNRMFADDNLAKFPDAVRLSENIALAISDEGIIGVLNGMMKRPSRLLLMEEGRVPGLWILGAKDNYIPCGVMKSRVNLPGNARLLILDNSGHMGFVEEKDLAVKELAGFIRNVL